MVFKITMLVRLKRIWNSIIKSNKLKGLYLILDCKLDSLRKGSFMW